MQYEFHPIANIFPMLDDARLKELAVDIHNNGQAEPIVIFEDKILDGRNRYKACEIAGVNPIYRPYAGDDPIKYVISLNLHRRHLSTSQRAMVAANLVTLEWGKKKGDTSNDVSQPDAAKALNISVPSVQRAAVVKNAGTEELKQAVINDKITVSLAAQVAALPKETQAEIVKNLDQKVVKAHVKKEQQNRRDKAAVKRTQPRPGALPPNCMLHHCDLADAPIEPNSVDYIITDPPYPREFIPLYGVLARKASEWLKPGGSLIAMAGEMPHGLGEDPIPPPEVLDERRRAQQHWPNVFGDPLPGRSALDRRNSNGIR
jgi:ParB-like chromosome segregation protein Spo0J